MKDIIQEYLTMKEIQKLTTQGIEAVYTGWEENNGFERLYEVKYSLAQEQQKLHDCRIFDIVKISDEQYRCQICKKTHGQKSFQDLKKATSIRYCHCGGISKKMQVHVPHPASGYETHAIYYCCLYCGGKYMYHKFTCDTESCNKYCDITEVYCLECRQNMKKA